MDEQNKNKCKYSGSTERAGLYIMVFIILLHTCSTDSTVDRIESKLKSIKQIEVVTP